MRIFVGCLVVAVACLAFASDAQADTFDVLWYTGGVDTFGGTYNSTFSTTLTARALSGGSGGEVAGHTWNITFWAGGATPGGSFDAMVVASGTGGWTPYPDYTDLNTAAGGMTLGDRVMVTGQDADFHFIHNVAHQSSFDSSQGFLINAINWASSGTGMGAVFLDVDGSVLSAFGQAGLGSELGGTDAVTIPGPVSGFPINEDLTTAGLSNWGTSSHSQWSGWDAALWTGINTGPLGAVTLISADTDDGGTTPVPEPGSIALLGLGLAGLGFASRRRKARAS